MKQKSTTNSPDWKNQHETRHGRTRYGNLLLRSRHPLHPKQRAIRAGPPARRSRGMASVLTSGWSYDTPLLVHNRIMEMNKKMRGIPNPRETADDECNIRIFSAPIDNSSEPAGYRELSNPPRKRLCQ